MKKVLIITYYWPPSGGGGVQRWLKFVKYLPEFGIEPIVLTVDEKFATYPVVDQSLRDDVSQDVKVYYTKSSEPFKTYQKVTGKKEVPHSGFANKSKVGSTQKIMRFVRGNFFIPDARKGWNKSAYEKARQLISEFNIDTVITTSPPHSSQLIGLKLKRNLKINWVADLRDPWTDIYYYDQLYHTSIAKMIDRNYEKKVFANADKVITVSKAVKNQFLAKDDALQKSKFVVIPNGYDAQDFKQGGSIDKTKFVITYTGTIAANYNIGSFLKAILRLAEETNDKTIRLKFVGVVAEEYKNLIENTNLQKITEFVGHVAHAKSIQYLTQSTILFLAIPHVENNEGIVTGKLFEYLGARKPIVGVGPVQGDASRIIDECGAGKMFDYHEQNELFDYLLNIYMRWENGNRLLTLLHKEKKYSRKSLTCELANLIKA